MPREKQTKRRILAIVLFGFFIFGPYIVGIGLGIKGVMLMNDAYALVEFGAGFTNANIAANAMWIMGTVLLFGGIVFSLFWTGFLFRYHPYANDKWKGR